MSRSAQETNYVASTYPPTYDDIITMFVINNGLLIIIIFALAFVEMYIVYFGAYLNV